MRNEVLRDLYCSRNVVREEQGAGRVALKGGKFCAQGVLVGKP